MSKGLLAITALALSSCAPAAWPTGGELPGWYGVPEEPANAFAGEARLRLVNGGLAGEVTLTTPLYFAIKWEGVDPQPITGIIDPSTSTSFSAPAFEPPAGARVPKPGSPACSTAEGRLVAYAVRPGGSPDPALDELIGAAFKPEWLFPYQQAAYNERLTWSSCAAGAGDLMPMQFQHDPRLALALCDTASDSKVTVCGQPPLDRTRIHAIELSVSDEGHVFIGPNYVAFTGEPVTFVVNGISFPGVAGQLDTTLAGGPWRAGRNTVEVRQGMRSPWSAEVVLPVHSLRPRLHEERLREGESFTASWDEAPWAQRYRLLSHPLDVPATRTAYPSWNSELPSVTDTFPGFDDGAGGRVLPARARLTLRVSAAVSSPSAFAPFHSSAGYEVMWSEGLDVAVQ